MFDYDGEEEPSEYLVKWFKEMACFNVIYELNGSSDNLDEFFAQHSEVVANVYDRMDKKRRTEG